jgi:hypothetical protein
MSLLYFIKWYWLMLAGSHSTAQHCPFDGFSIVVVQLKSAKTGKPRTTEGYTMELRNKGANDSCQQISKPFDAVQAVLIDSADAVFKQYAAKFANAPIFKPGHFAVLLRDDELRCTQGNSSLHKAQQQSFEVFYVFRKFRRKRSVTVAVKNIYPLCTVHGSWNRIQPIVIALPAMEVFDGH